MDLTGTAILVARRVRRRGDQTLRQLVPAWRKSRKYAEELAFWRNELVHLRRWYDGDGDWWGVSTPSAEQKQDNSPLWATNAVLTLHRLRPTYLEELQLSADHFTGQRVLEVGCGPLVPLLQFTGCIRHGLDPLADLYTAAGWPLYDYAATITCAPGESMPYPDGYFDSAISVNALDHVDDFERVTAEMQRVVTPGGHIYIDVEYHRPTVAEPLLLDDARVRDAFNRCDMRKVIERGKQEIFRSIADRFGLLPSVYANFTNEERFACWHGEIRV